MRHILTYIITFSLLVAACQKPEVADDKQPTITPCCQETDSLTYTESLEEWEKLKQYNGDSYSYRTTFTSWTGFGGTTSIYVQDGTVVKREYEAFEIDATTGAKLVTETYSETGMDIGSHYQGAPAKTIDELYVTCAGEYLVADQSENTLYFETADNGLLATCGFVPNNCADDCFVGITIDMVMWTSN